MARYKEDEYLDEQEFEEGEEAEEEEEQAAGGRPSELGWGPSYLLSTGAHALMLLLLAAFVMSETVRQEDPIIPMGVKQVEKPPVEAEKINVYEKNSFESEKLADQPLFVHNKKAVVATEMETKNEVEMQHKAKGEQDAISDVPLGGAGILDCMGLGGGAGGAYGWRDGGGKRNAVLAGGGGPATESSVNAALRWLMRHQSPDGHWDCRQYGGAPDKPEHNMGDYDVAVTGLAVLAFLGAGHTADSSSFPPFQECVRKAMYWLEENQKPSGTWGEGLMYAHNIATLAVGEHHGMTQTRRELAQKAVDYLLQQQNARVGGWDYFRPNTGRTDTSISGWGVMALKSAKIAGLNVGQGLERAAEHFRAAAGGGGSNVPGKIWYSLMNGKGDNPGKGSAQLPITALALLYLGVAPDSPWMVEAASRMGSRPPNMANFYEMYYASLALMQMGGANWDNFNEQMKTGMLAAQVKEGDDRGSWDPAAERYGVQGGRVYTTALGAMIMEVYYRYMPIYEQGG